jgi:hypothetical protein
LLKICSENPGHKVSKNKAIPGMLLDGGDVKIGGELVDEVLKVIQTTNAEPTKKVGRTNVAPMMKKGVKAKLQSVKVILSPVQPSSPVL